MSAGPIKVFYSCEDCGVTDVAVMVERRRSDEGVVEWMKDLAKVLGLHHELRKVDTCHTGRLALIKVPLSGTATELNPGRIGDPS